jgi:predicted GNAT family acetyltransferase
MHEKVQNAELIVNDPECQFEIHLDDHLAFIEFVRKGKKIWLTHTEVPKSLEGQGIGSALVEKVLQHLKKEKLVLIPSCSFVAAYVNEHSEWQEILSEGYQM